MRTVVMLTWEYPPHMVGGLSRHVSALAKQLAAQGVSVHVLTQHSPDAPAQEVLDGVHVVRVAPYFQEPSDFRLWVCHLNFALLEAGARLISDLQRPVILHAHDWLVAHAARGLKHLFRSPLVATIHATEHGRQHGIWDTGQQYIKDVEWWLTYEAWRVVVCSQSMRMEVRSLFGLSGDKVRVIPNGVDLPPNELRIDAPPREQFVRPDERLLFYVGRLVPEKGAAVLLEAMPHLLQRYPTRLVIAGVGPYGAELRRKADELQLQERVHFTGWVDDGTVHALYQHADVAVVPSTYEPFGIVALEAMAAGCPLVVSNVGGLAEIVRHDDNGLKAWPGDPLSLAEQIGRLLENPTVAHRIAARAQWDAMHRFSWVTVAQATADLYTALWDESQSSGWTPPGSDFPPPASGPLPGRYDMPH